jgi:HSP20 family molecular chaperone IbpA
MPEIPYDIYESPNEVVIIIPLAWVKKEDISITIDNYKLKITWIREKILLKEDFIPLKEECYRWKIELEIDLPPQSYFDRIHSKISTDNVLQIIVPKALIPEKIELEVEYN